MIEFREFPKIARLSRECVITEKIDGTNASIYVPELPEDATTSSGRVMPFLCGSRTRWIFPENDNHGFAKWAYEHVEELLRLGPGHHFGEWWGAGIQRRYDLKEKRFSLFNVGRWTAEELPPCVSVVPTLYRGPFVEEAWQGALNTLIYGGSVASPGFLNPEGIVIWHEAARIAFKKTIEKDEAPKGLSNGHSDAR